MIACAIQCLYIHIFYDSMFYASRAWASFVTYSSTWTYFNKLSSSTRFTKCLNRMEYANPLLDAWRTEPWTSVCFYG